MTAPSPAAAGLPAEDVERVARPWPDVVLVEGDWISPSREAHARDLLKAWADAAANAGCPPAFVERMRRHVEVHERARAAAAALAEMRPTAAEGAVKRVEAVLPRLDKEARISSFPLRFGYEDSARLIRAALAPVSDDADGGERR